MRHRSVDLSLSKVARIIGLLYLAIIISGIFAEFFVRQSLFVAADAGATAQNIIASEGLFRLGIAADIIMISCDVALALLFYILLKPVNKSLSLLAAFFRLTQAAVLAVNLSNLFIVLQLLSGLDYLTGFSSIQLHAAVMLSIKAHATGYSVGLIFFGIHCAILAYLLYRSDFIPRILGVLIGIAALGYLIDSFAQILVTNYANYQNIFTLVVFLPAFVGELSLCLWLLVKGVKVSEERSTI
ncbi:MAG: DUF4386 domain-containing protein [bacterium]|nr:MAG: DUF4386 domain-containing protein [bacterium]